MVWEKVMDNRCVRGKIANRDADGFLPAQVSPSIVPDCRKIPTSKSVSVLAATAPSRGLPTSGRPSDSGQGGLRLVLGRPGRGISLSHRGSSHIGVDTARSTAPHSRARHGKVLEAVVDAEVGIFVGGLVRARELHRRSGGAAAASGDLDLDARHEVLGFVHEGLVDAWEEKGGRS